MASVFDQPEEDSVTNTGSCLASVNNDTEGSTAAVKATSTIGGVIDEVGMKEVYRRVVYSFEVTIYGWVSSPGSG